MGRFVAQLADLIVFAVRPPLSSFNIAQIVAGSGVGQIGYNGPSVVGSKIPAAVVGIGEGSINGAAVRVIQDQTIAGVFQVVLAGTLAQSHFTSITINGVTKQTSTASFSTPSGNSQWDFAGAIVGLVDGTTYNVTVA